MLDPAHRQLFLDFPQRDSRQSCDTSHMREETPNVGGHRPDSVDEPSRCHPVGVGAVAVALVGDAAEARVRRGPAGVAIAEGDQFAVAVVTRGGPKDAPVTLEAESTTAEYMPRDFPDGWELVEGDKVTANLTRGTLYPLTNRVTEGDRSVYYTVNTDASRQRQIAVIEMDSGGS